MQEEIVQAASVVLETTLHLQYKNPMRADVVVPDV